MTERMMICSYDRADKPGEAHGKYGHIRKPAPSNSDAAFFESRPDQAYDRYYCGCWGWD